MRVIHSAISDYVCFGNGTCGKYVCRVRFWYGHATVLLKKKSIFGLAYLIQAFSLYVPQFEANRNTVCINVHLAHEAVDINMHLFTQVE